MTGIPGSIRSEFSFGPYRVSILVPDPEQVRMAWASVEERGASAFPYWSRVWPAALGMGEFLSRHPELFRRKTVLEIGAGLGLPSLICAQEAGSVLCTDQSVDAIAYARASATLNGLENFRVQTFDWTSEDAPIACELLLLSDINYAPESFASIIALLDAYIAGGTLVIVSTPHRLSAREFIQRIEPWIQHRAAFLVGDEGQQSPVSVYVLHGSNAMQPEHAWKPG